MTDALRLLIADDEALELEAIALFAQAYGGFGAIATAVNGLEAVESARDFRPDIIVLDIRMPGLDGMAAAAAIRDFDKRTRIVFLTAFGQLDYAQAAFKVQADDFLLKPVTEEVFRQAMDRASAALRESGATAAKMLGEGRTGEDRLIRAVRQGDEAEAEAVAQRLFCLPAAGGDDLPGTRRAAMELIARLDAALAADFNRAAPAIADTADELRRSRSSAEVCAIITKTIRNLAKQSADAQSRPHRQAVESVLRYIDSHWRESINLETAARMAGLSRFHFSRIFRSEVGATFSDYLTAKRIAKAKSCLADHSLPMKRICELCGFSDPAYFAGVFRKHTGVSPSDYRALAAGKVEAKQLLKTQQNADRIED